MELETFEKIYSKVVEDVQKAEKEIHALLHEPNSHVHIHGRRRSFQDYVPAAPEEYPTLTRLGRIFEIKEALLYIDRLQLVKENIERGHTYHLTTLLVSHGYAISEFT